MFVAGLTIVGEEVLREQPRDVVLGVGLVLIGLPVNQIVGRIAKGSDG